MAKIYYQEDCNLSMLEGKTIAIIGYGSQGHAHALNLKESGCNVIIGLYEGSRSWKRAEEQGLIEKIEPHTTSLMYALGDELNLAYGDQTNIKITTKEDFDMFEGYVLMKQRKMM